MKPLHLILLVALLLLGSGCEQRILGELRVAAEGDKYWADCFTMPSARIYKTWGQSTHAERRDIFGTRFATEVILSDIVWNGVADSLRPSGVELGNAREWRTRHFAVASGTVLPEEPRDAAGLLQVEFIGIERPLAERVIAALEQNYRTVHSQVMSAAVQNNISHFRSEAAEITNKLARSDLTITQSDYLNKLLAATREHLAENEEAARGLLLNRQLKSARLR
ncbi:MAG: hypothetical protein Q8N18_10095 [Opitutaceae bacterium]|nr:hypothetical protein [Opitutaceae bacterium]